MKPVVVFLPGFNGAARQPILLRVAAALGSEIDARFPGLPRGRPSAGLAREVAHVRAVLPRVRRVVLVGRSFGGRVAVRCALQHPVAAVVVLGFPIRPKDRPRPEDEAALDAVKAPVLIVQGSEDELGPLEVLAPLIAANPRLAVSVLDGAGHSFGRHEKQAVTVAAEFIRQRLSGSRRRSLGIRAP
jgi:pimeloyl-ACP methyl ester carboxylesterase